MWRLLNATYYPEDMSNCKVFETCKVMHDVLNGFTSAAPLQKHIWALLYDVSVYYVLYIEGLRRFLVWLSLVRFVSMIFFWFVSMGKVMSMPSV